MLDTEKLEALEYVIEEVGIYWTSDEAKDPHRLAVELLPALFAAGYDIVRAGASGDHRWTDRTRAGYERCPVCGTIRIACTTGPLLIGYTYRKNTRILAEMTEPNSPPPPCVPLTPKESKS